MPGHRYSLSSIVGWLLHGIIQWVRDVVPILKPEAEPQHPPQWYLYWQGWGTWVYNLDKNRIPSSFWIQMYLDAAWKSLGRWIEEVGAIAEYNGNTALVALVGVVKRGYDNVGIWVGAIDDRVGLWSGFIANTVSLGVTLIWSKLPESVRNGLKSFWDLLEDAKNAVWQWVLNRYEEAKTWATSTWNWLITTGKAIENWWVDVKKFVSGFQANPWGTIFNILPPDWQELITVVGDCIRWLRRLWDDFHKELMLFLDDPALYMWDKLVAEIERRW